MHDEYAIFDDRGVQFGLPAKSFTDRDAADRALEFLRDRRREIEKTAHDADEALKNNPDATYEQKKEWQEEVIRWDQEKSRVYSICKRAVGPWGAA